MENGDLVRGFSWIFALKMVIFHCYVSLPEGKVSSLYLKPWRLSTPNLQQIGGWPFPAWRTCESSWFNGNSWTSCWANSRWHPNDVWDTLGYFVIMKAYQPPTTTTVGAYQPSLVESPVFLGNPRVAIMRCSSSPTWWPTAPCVFLVARTKTCAEKTTSIRIADQHYMCVHI